MDKVVIEKWIKPPKIVTYTNASLKKFEGGFLSCFFEFPDKYKNGGFYIGNKKILKKNQMYYGQRIFYQNRFYSLLIFYTVAHKISGYYIDIVLPPKLSKNKVIVFDLKIDFFVLPDKQTYYLLDRDEFEEAINKNLFGIDEIDVCNEVTNTIENFIKTGNFNKIFTNYKKSSFEEWEIYNKYPQVFVNSDS